ncbi:MAG TPA: 50S ribosomal protein L17 [Candidatus Paceibacterota bacterium]
MPRIFEGFPISNGMNHHKATRKFGRVKKVRDGLMKSLALSLVLKEKIKTTDAKARELRPMAEKLITLGRLGTVASRRLLVSRIGVLGAEKIVKDLAPKYKGRAGGYTRITKLQARLSDGSLIAVIEFV